MSGNGSYISREAAIKKLDHFQSHLHTVEGTCAIGVAKTLIKELPAADVRTVVLCKDCRMSNACSDEREMYCTLFFKHMPVNHFCSFGKEKSNESLN